LKLIEKKRKLSQTRKEDSSDVISLFLTDENFKEDIQLIIDECIEFMIAGTMTTASLVENLII